MTATPARPWYKHAHLWFILGLPAVAVVASLYTAYLAATTSDGLVSDDYYRQGREINREFKRDDKARELKLSAQIQLSSDSQFIRVVFNQDVTPPLRLKLVHPTQQGFDHTLTLKPMGPKMWSVPLDRPLESQRWKLELEDESKTWRLTGNWNSHRDDSILLTPKPAA